MDSTRSPLGHTPFKDLKSRLKGKPPEKQQVPREPAREPARQPEAQDPEADREFFRQAMEGTRPMGGSNRDEGKGKPVPASLLR